MTDLRSEFEKIFGSSPYEYSMERWPNDPAKYGWPDQYKEHKAQIAWEGYQAAAASLMARLPVDSVHAAIEALSEQTLSHTYDLAYSIVKAKNEKHIAALTQLLEQKQ